MRRLLDKQKEDLFNMARNGCTDSDVLNYCNTHNVSLEGAQIFMAHTFKYLEAVSSKVTNSSIYTYFTDLSDDVLEIIIREIIDREQGGYVKRCESLVPFAEKMKDYIGSAYDLRQGLELGQNLALLEFAKRHVPSL